MRNDTYVYPDRNEELTSNLINTYGKKRWTIEEEYILKKTLRTVGKVETSLDAGTGMGRLIPFLRSFSKKVIAIDPDEQRLRVAQQNNPYENVFFFKGKASELSFIRSGNIDFINFSHVAQHIPHWELIKTLGEFRRIAKKGSFILFLTTHSESSEKFLLVCEEGSKEVSKDEYEEFAMHPILGKLPVRKFEVEWLERLFEISGFKVVWKTYYHIKPKFLKEFGRDWSIGKMLEKITSEDMRHMALDVAYLLGR